MIRTKPSLSARLENVLTNVLTKLDSTSNNVNAMLSEKNQQAFSTALDNIARSSAHLEPALQSVAPALQRMGQGGESLAHMGNSVSQTSRSADQAMGAITVDAKRIGTDTLPELERLLGELGVLSASLRRLSEQTERAPSSLLFRHPAVKPGPGETAPEESRP